MELQLTNNNNNNNSKLIEYSLKNEINSLSEQLESLKNSNESLESKYKETLNSIKEETSLRIRILQSQERLLKDQIQQLIDNPIKPPKDLKFGEIEYQTELEFVNLIDQLEHYENHLNEQLDKSNIQLENEKRLFEETKVIGKNLLENDKALQKSKEILSKQLIHLAQKEEFQTRVLLNFIKNYSLDLYNDGDDDSDDSNNNKNKNKNSSNSGSESDSDDYGNGKQLKRKNTSTPKSKSSNNDNSNSSFNNSSNNNSINNNSSNSNNNSFSSNHDNKLKREETLIYILEQLMNIFMDDNQKYISVRDPILLPPPSPSYVVESISEEIELLLKAGIIEKDPLEPKLIRIVSIL